MLCLTRRRKDNGIVSSAHRIQPSRCGPSEITWPLTTLLQSTILQYPHYIDIINDTSALLSKIEFSNLPLAPRKVMSRPHHTIHTTRTHLSGGDLSPFNPVVRAFSDPIWIWWWCTAYLKPLMSIIAVLMTCLHGGCYWWLSSCPIQLGFDEMVFFPSR